MEMGYHCSYCASPPPPVESDGRPINIAFLAARPIQWYQTPEVGKVGISKMVWVRTAFNILCYQSEPQKLGFHVRTGLGRNGQETVAGIDISVLFGRHGA